MTLPDTLEPLAHDTHTFAAVVRAIGRGPGRGRSLTEAEAEAALLWMLRGAALPEQIGAVLMLLRYRSETPAETAGFVRAVRQHSHLPRAGDIDLDWPSYADGTPRSAAWQLAAAKLLGSLGIRTVIHGPLDGAGRGHIAPALDALAIPVRDQPGDAPVTFCPTAAFAPDLARLLALRGVLGLRSPLNTVARLVNPWGAGASLDGVFHPPYIALHVEAATLLGQPCLGVLKGGGGEALRTPLKPVTLHRLQDGRLDETRWPPLAPDSPATPLDSRHVAAVWDGTIDDPRGSCSVIGTAAMALFTLGRAGSPAEADAMATELWEKR